MIFRFVRTSRVNEWLKNNSPASLVGTPGDNWRKHLQSNGGTGSTFHDLEQSYLAAQGSLAATIVDRWSKFTASSGTAGAVFLDRVRSYFESIATPPQEDPYSGQPMGAGDFLFITYP